MVLLMIGTLVTSFLHIFLQGSHQPEKNNPISDAPEWVNVDFLTNVLNPDGNNDTIINSMHIKRATKPGTGFSSIVYRANLEITRGGMPESTSVVFKVPKADINYVEFVREVDVYNDAIPGMNKLLKEALGEEFQHYAPECYYASRTVPGPIVVMEDLKLGSFIVPEVPNGLDLKHCLLVLKRVALYQAASAVFYAKNPQELKHIKSSIYVDINLGSPRINFPPAFRKLAEDVGKLPEYRERFYDKLSKFADNLIDIFLDGVTPDENEFNVLAHFDLWINNIMFQYDKSKNEPVDVRIIDYQMSAWASPAIDIQRFLLTLGDDQVILKYDYVVEEYYKTLNDTLSKLGYSNMCPTRDQFNAQLKRRVNFGVMFSLLKNVGLKEDETDLTQRSKVFLDFFEKRKWL